MEHSCSPLALCWRECLVRTKDIYSEARQSMAAGVIHISAVCNASIIKRCT